MRKEQALKLAQRVTEITGIAAPICVSKLMAGRDKDFAFIVGLLEGGLIELETFLERVALVIEMPQKDALLPRLAKLEDELRRTHGGYNLKALQQLQTRLRD